MRQIFEKFSSLADRGMLFIVFFGISIIIYIYMTVSLKKEFRKNNPDYIYITILVVMGIAGYVAGVTAYSMKYVEPDGFISQFSFGILKYGSVILLIISGTIAIIYISVPVFQSRLLKAWFLGVIWSPLVVLLVYDGGVWEFLKNLSEYRFIDPVGQVKQNDEGILDNVVRFFFFFVLIGVHLQYFFEKARIWRDEKRTISSESDFHSGSIDLFFLFLSMSFSLILGLLLSGANPISVSIFSGVLAAGFSLAFRELLNNVVAGVILYLDNSLRSGHVIELADGWVGKVNQFTLRYTQLEDRDKVEALIPNSRLISERILNFSRNSDLVRLAVEIPLPLNTQIRDISKALEGAALRCKRVHKGPSNPPKLFLLRHSYWASHVQLRFWITTPSDGIANIKSEVMMEVGETLRELTISLPRPHISIDGDESARDLASTDQVGRLTSDLELKPEE